MPFVFAALSPSSTALRLPSSLLRVAVDEDESLTLSVVLFVEFAKEKLYA